MQQVQQFLMFLLYLFYIRLTDGMILEKNRAKNVEGASDVRLPITQNILEKIISLVPFVIESHYVQVTVQTMFAIAFYGLMRVSEICPKENKGSLCNKVLQFDDVGFNRKNGITSLFVTIRHFKVETQQITQTCNLSVAKTVWFVMSCQTDEKILET